MKCLAQPKVKKNRIVTKILKKTSRFDKGRINLKEFVEELPKLESHYCRKSSTKLYVEQTFKTKSELYLLYKDNWCVEHNYPLRHSQTCSKI